MHIKNIWNKKLNKNIENDYSDSIMTGISVSEDIKIKGSSDNVYRYILNGLLIFCATYGSMTCYLTSFSIEYYSGLLFIALLVIGMLYAFMHISKKIRKIGYVVVFISYIYMVIKLRVVIKSGFSRMVNITLEYIEEVYILPVIKRYSEYVEDGKMAVTICLIVIGFVISLLLNIIISEFMSTMGVLVVTLPIAQLGMYFDLKPSYLSYFMFIICPIVVFCIKLSGRYCISDNEAVYRYAIKNGKSQLKYSCEPGATAQATGVIIGVAAIIILILSPFITHSNYGTNNAIKQIKRSTNVYVRDFAISGIAGLFGKDEGAGGVNGGRLGDVNVVRLDYKTDLRVTFVPLSDDRFFLKAFTGSIYGDNQWETLSTRYKTENLAKEMDELWTISDYDMYNITSSHLKWDFENNDSNAICKSKIEIKNLDANSQYAYLPYYTYTDNEYCYIYSDDEAYMGVQRINYDAEYYYDTKGISDYSSVDYEKRYNEIIENGNVEKSDSSCVDALLYSYLVRSLYMEVPEKNKDVVKKICEEGNLKKEDEDIINSVVEYLDEKYTYSLKCGKTPDNKDFINYFLDEKEEGYCAHFASAAVLIYRYLGIPARYVEGYVVDSWDYEVAKDKNVSDYIEGCDRDNLVVVNADITDSKAHAWVEIYENGFGWVPIDVTPANDEDNRTFSAGGFLSSILGLFASNETEAIANDNKNNIMVSTFERIKGNKSFIARAFIIIFAGLLLSATFRYVIIKINRKRMINSANKNKGVISLYEYFEELTKFINIGRKKGITFEEYLKNNKEIYLYAEEKVIRSCFEIIEKAEYSEKDIQDEEFEVVKNCIYSARFNIMKKLNIWKKITFIFAKVL